MNVVVGSGPSGVFAAEALLTRGERVTVLDVGDTVSPEAEARARGLGAREPEAWRDDERRELSRWNTPDPRVPKASFGELYPYALDEVDAWSQRGTRCLHSHARGGLSTVWGAAVLPYRAVDLAGWPVGLDALAPHYRAVTARLDVAGAHDLDDDFAPYGDLAPPAPASRQAAALLARLEARRDALRREGITFGRARLALRTRDDDPRRCRRVGLCHQGCPYGAIWRADDLLDDLLRDPRVTYRPGVRVARVESTAAGVRVHGVARDGSPVAVDGARAFVGCGPVGTARVVAASLGRGVVEVPLAYQPYFLLPMVMLDDAGDVEGERAHALAQLFVELDDPRASSRRVHLQVYTHSAPIADAIDVAARWLGPLGARARRSGHARLVAVQGYLHSDEGDPVSLRVDPSSPRPVSLRAPDDPRGRRAARRAAVALARHARDLGLLPVLPALRVGAPGEGNHIGATFPMRARPAGLETDRRGALAALPDVHLIDASTLPALAAPTLTLTVMANARRVATEAVEAACAAR